MDIENDTQNAGEQSAAPAGSAYWLLKQIGGNLSMHRFDNETELRKHMEAMWRFTDWHVVAVGIRPNGPGEPLSPATKSLTKGTEK